MAFVQTGFLNSTVTSFSAGIGWGETPSQIIVDLVDDPLINNSFTPKPPGFPVTFSFGGFNFTGIIQSYHSNDDTGGFTHQVTVVDPREVLSGTYLILDGYTGSVTTFNLLNIYGYLENISFGNSKKNESGIPWKKIQDTIHKLTNLPQQERFGGPIYYMSSRYIVDLTSLPLVPEDYRVGGDSITMLDYINEICDAGGCDYFITMTETFIGVFVIKVNTVSRTAFINYGAVSQFLNSFSEFESRQSGMELSQDPTSRFVIGGSVRELWYQHGDLSLNTIWPYWGLDINGNPIIGTGLGNDHNFVLDSRSVNNPRVGPFYHSDVAEMRAVLGGRANWETFLILNRDGSTIHKNKAVQLNIIGYIANKNPTDILNELLNNYNTNNNQIVLDPGSVLFPHTVDNLNDYEQLDVETGYLYEFLYYIATEFYGKKFMVNIPYTLATEEPDTGIIRVSQIPVNSGYLDENLWPVAIQNNLVPVEVDHFSEEDGQIICYVRFNDGSLLDFSEISNDSIGYNSSNPQFGINKLLNYAVFVKATVEERVVFLDKITQFGPKAVITLDGVVRERMLQSDYPGKDIIIKFLKDGFSANGIDTTKPEFQTDVLDKFASYIGQDMLNYGAESTAVIPDMAVIPLESQTKFYGPWYANGAPGKVDYEKDDSLVPWNYGGFTAMNIVANARVTAGIGLNLNYEQGEITFPDAPFHNLGQALIAGGPLVTDVTVNIGSNGAHTTYQFKRTVKQPRYGLAKADRVATLARRAQQVRRNIRLQNYNKRRPDVSLSSRPIDPNTINHPKKVKASSHEMIVGQSYLNNDGERTNAVFIQSDYNFTSHIKTNYTNKAFSSLDAIFQPFSTVPHSSLPYFTTPASGAEQPTVIDLNPYYRHNFKLVGRGSGLPSDLYGNDASGNYRGIALHAPLILSGNGYNTAGSSVTDKTGPLDSRWDETRGVWVAGVGGSIVRATSLSFIGAISSSGQANLENGGDVLVYNWLRQPICSGDRLLLAKVNGRYDVLQAEFRGINAITNITCVSGKIVSEASTIYLPSAYIRPSGNWSCS